MYRYINDLHKMGSDPHSAESAATIARAASRQHLRLQAPERVHPKNLFGSLQASLSKFLENRDRTIEYIQNCRDDLRLRIIDHPLGLMNAEDCLKVIISHPARHVRADQRA